MFVKKNDKCNKNKNMHILVNLYICKTQLIL